MSIADAIGANEFSVFQSAAEASEVCEEILGLQTDPTPTATPTPSPTAEPTVQPPQFTG